MPRLRMTNFVNKMMKRIFGCVFAVISAGGHASSVDSFVGEWDWSSSSGTMTFSIDLKEKDGKIYGQYCAVAQNGNKIDCDNEENNNIHGIVDDSGKSSFVNFHSFFGAKDGGAILRVVDGYLIWHVARNPRGGEFYAPKDAILMPHRLMMERVK